jgi:hypothetical protein
MGTRPNAAAGAISPKAGRVEMADGTAGGRTGEGRCNGTQQSDRPDLAATNRNLQAMAEDGTVREDLCYRLAPPPLPGDEITLADLPDEFARRPSGQRTRRATWTSAGAR